MLPVALRYYRDLYLALKGRTFPTGDIYVPTLSIFGDNDPTAKYSAREEPFYKGPYKRIVQPGIGHWPHLEMESEFNRLVLDWFNTYPAADTAKVTAQN